ncbi:14 kDa phosphohistidine phosphatase, putative [Pediculus humanus corporis]|uniref:14 kDa phosphohistidine phosphatase, putative n=1 Tax=Pediculus humanus subsp. corporis TaxID=121224 RepID=E0VU90_PEDHC|nr:14 kDa phosphohistidine phosphatase, putative [Pediculus humanus corporis]EEB16946.1 14 kDa phosphohistidine phosphatase, putative [Pediculus humanus corporis]
MLCGDIYDEVTSKELEPKKLDSECLGGGRILHEPNEKKMKVHDLSQGFGKADHSITADLLKKVYRDYTITWSDERY